MAAVPPRRRRTRLAVPLAIVLAVLSVPVIVPPGIAAEPLHDTDAASPAAVTPAAARPFRLNLARGGDYVRQTNFVRCVGASVQMMLNITRPGADRSRPTQRRLQVLARSQSGPRPDGRERQGAGVFGWAAALNMEGAGPYAVVGASSLQGAMRIAAKAIVEQRRPVGLLVWQGRHAWVMSGFEASGDPRDGSFRVNRAYILDPLHPYGSKQWGPSPVPGTAVSVDVVGRQFIARRRHSEWNLLPGMAELAGKWVLVVPVDGPAPPNPVAAAGLAARVTSRIRTAPEPPAAPWIVGPLSPH